MTGKTENHSDGRKNNSSLPHLWKKGQSGNPAGKPKGSGSLSWFNSHVRAKREEIIDSVVERAMKGNSTAMELVISRMIPSFQPSDEAVNLDGFKEAKSRTDRAKIVTEGVSEGIITPNQGVVIMTVLEKAAKIQEVDDLSQRLEAVEKAMKKKKD